MIGAASRTDMPRLLIFTLTGLVGILGFVSVKAAAALVFAALALMVYTQRPLYCLGTFILIAPFSYTPILNYQIAGIPGLKVPNLLLILSLAVYLASRKTLKLSKNDVFFLAGIALLLTLSVFRSLPEIVMINYLTADDLNTKRYLFSYLIRPLTYLIPFFIVAGYMREKREINSIINLLILSTITLSIAIWVIYIGFAPSKTSFETIRNTISGTLNTHSNNIANFYILAFPLIMSKYFIRKNFLSITLIILSLTSVALLFSRTAYVLLPASILLMLLVSNKKRFVPVALAIGIVLVLAAPEIVRKRSMHGFIEGDLNRISAGRIERIWTPLVSDIKKNPEAIFVGKGRHAVLLSGVTEEDHAHNMYLGLFLETGIIGCLFFAVYFMLLLIRWGRAAMGTPGSDLHLFLQGILVSVVVYLISGLTGRHMFPYIGNLFLWVLIGTGLSIVRYHLPAKDSHEG